MAGRHMTYIRMVAFFCAAVSMGAAVAQNNNFADVEITAHEVAGNIHYLAGQGGNIGLSVGDDGILMIDTQFAPLTEKIVAAIRALSDGKVVAVVNTHVHGDHTGGNENLRALGYPVVAHDNVRVRLAQGVNGGEPAPEAARPAMTFGSDLGIHINGEDARLVKLPPAHTDGDVVVYFPVSNVLHTGDVFRTTGYPVFDVGNGGSARGTVAALQQLINLIGADTQVLPGHGDISGRTDIEEMADMVAEVLTRVTPMVAEGMTLEQVLAAAPTADLDERWGDPGRFLTGMYQSLVAEGP